MIEELARMNNIRTGRCRLTIYRGNGGYYTPESNVSGYTIELKELEENRYILNDVGLEVDIYPDMRKAINMLAIHKSLNSNFYIMASLWSKARGLDNCLLQNERGQ
jgi:branched-chain amino acid aminotransferase